MSIYKDYFADIVPRTDNESFTKEIITRKKSMHKKRFKRIVPVFAAAVVIALSGFTVYAAGSGIFNAAFGIEKNYSVFESIQGEMDIKTLTTVTDGITVTPIGYAADNHNIMSVFMLDFEQPLPEGNFFEKQYSNRNHSRTDNFFSILVDFGKGGNLGDAFTTFKRIDEDSLYAIYWIYSDNDISGDIYVKYTCLNLARDNGIDYEKPEFVYRNTLFEATYNVTIPEYEPTILDTTGTEYEAYEIELTPCGYNIRGKNITTDNKLQLVSQLDNTDEISITLKNGEVIKTAKTTSFGVYLFGWLELPVIPDEVDYLSMDDVKIYVK